MNNYTPEEIEIYKAIPAAVHVAGAEVAPTTGTPHLQGFITFVKNTTVKQARAMLPRAHVEKARAAEAARKYAEKDGELVINICRTRQGRRTDLEKVAEMVTSGASLREVAEEYPVVFMKMSRGIRELQTVLAEGAAQRFRDVKVYTIVGPTGIGKTRYVYDHHSFADIYSLTVENGRLWFDGYQGQSVLLIDEFRTGKFQISDMLRLLDGYPMRLPVKGGSAYAAWTTVYITSNQPVSDWFQDAHGALARRFATGGPIDLTHAS